MSMIHFNNAIINGVTISQEKFIGEGTIDVRDYMENITTLNHLVHIVKMDEKGEAEFDVYGDYGYLASQTTTTDDNNWGGEHKLYYDTTLIATFDGLVDASYNPETRKTKIVLNGEYHGYTG